MGKEQTIQSRILKWLDKNGFWSIKVVVSSVNGTPDIIACSPKGRFVAIEVKQGANTASALQKYNVEQVALRGGIAFVTWDLETVIYRLSGELIDEKPKESKPTGKFLL